MHLQHQLVSLPVLTNSKLINIGCPMTPISQDASWADRPQQETPSNEDTFFRFGFELIRLKLFHISITAPNFKKQQLWFLAKPQFISVSPSSAP